MFQLASVYFKIKPDSRDLHIKFLVLSQREFDRIVKFTEEFSKEEKEEISQEISLSKEMSYLIPLKIRDDR